MKNKTLGNVNIRKGATIGYLKQIYEKEEIKVVIRTIKGKTLDNGYDYERKSAVNTSASTWIEKRLRPIIGDCEVDIIDGRGQNPHGRTTLENIRKSYNTI